MSKPCKPRKLSDYVAAARSDLPTGEQVAAVAGAVGVSDATAASVAPVKTVSLAGSFGQWQVVVPVVVALGGAVGVGVLRSAAKPSAVSSPAAERVRLEPPRSATPAVEVPATPMAAPEVEPARPVPRPVPKTRVSPRLPRDAAMRASVIDDIEAESALVESARKALRVDPAKALALTAEHARAFPAGLLVVERKALAIQALSSLGRRVEGRGALDELERAHPRAAHLAGLRRALETETSEREP